MQGARIAPRPKGIFPFSGQIQLLTLRGLCTAVLVAAAFGPIASARAQTVQVSDANGNVELQASASDSTIRSWAKSTRQTIHRILNWRPQFTWWSGSNPNEAIYSPQPTGAMISVQDTQVLPAADLVEPSAIQGGQSPASAEYRAALSAGNSQTTIAASPGTSSYHGEFTWVGARPRWPAIAGSTIVTSQCEFPAGESAGAVQVLQVPIAGQTRPPETDSPDNIVVLASAKTMPDRVGAAPALLLTEQVRDYIAVSCGHNTSEVEVTLTPRGTFEIAMAAGSPQEAAALSDQIMQLSGLTGYRFAVTVHVQARRAD
jgi:hypothetical protein